MGCCGTGNGYGSGYGCCDNRKVERRCTDITVSQLILGDQNGAILVDDFGTAFSLGIIRDGSNFEFEFNRQKD